MRYLALSLFLMPAFAVAEVPYVTGTVSVDENFQHLQAQVKKISVNTLRAYAQYASTQTWSGQNTFLNEVTISSAIKFSDNTQQVTAFKIYESGDQTITSDTTLTLTHGLGGTPRILSFFIKNTSADCGWSVGEIVEIPGSIYTSAVDNKSHAIHVNATNIYVKFSVREYVYALLDKSTAAGCDATNAKWKLIVNAIR